MAIQQKRGADADFDANKMLAGEMAITTDGTRKVYAAFAPGDVKELASAEEVQKIVDEFNESATEDIEKAKEEIEYKKEEVLKDIPDYKKQVEELELHKANSILCKTSGTTIQTTDSAAVKPNITPFGKSTQRQYEGHQLLDVSVISSNRSNGITFTTDGDYITITGTHTATYTAKDINLPTPILAGTTVYLYIVEGDATNIDFYARKSNKENIETFVKNGAITCDSDIYHLRLVCNSAITYDKSLKLMLTTVENAEYEPFVGNAPSPSLEYKQEVTPIGASGSVTEKLLTTQYYDASGITTSNTDTTAKREVDSEGWITVSLDNTTGTANKYMNVFIPATDSIKAGEKYLCVCEVKENTLNYLEVSSLESRPYYQFNTGFVLAPNFVGVSVSEIIANDNFADALYTLRTVCRAIPGRKGSVTFRISIIKDTSVTADNFVYEPYSEQSITLQTPNGLHGIPLGQTIPDAIKNSPIHMSGVYWDEVEQQYYIGDTKNENGKDVQRINRKRIERVSKYSDNEKFGSSALLDNLVIPSTRAPTMSTHFRYSAKGIENGICFVYGGQIRLYDDCGSVEAFNELLAQNEVYVDYILADPIITDISAEDLEQYNAVHMNYPNTTIVNDAGAYMEVEYVADTKEHIKQNYTPNSVTQDIQQRLSNVEALLTLNS